MSPTSFIDGIGALAGRYQGFILDQWGVIHDGRAALPAALHAITELRRRGKRLILLSNSGRRAQLNRDRLAGMGFDLDQFDAVVTSGEIAWQQIRRRAAPPFAELGRRCLLLTIGGDLGVVEGLGLELVDDAAGADFILLTGLEIPPRTLAGYAALVEPAAARGVPMLCSNPDRVAPVTGELVTAPGSLAALYAEMGGPVHFIGKPYPAVYAACREALAGLEAEAIVAIGDSMEHDVKGAQGAGLASCFLLEGIHAAAFPRDMAEAELRQGVRDLATRYGTAPVWVTRRLRW